MSRYPASSGFSRPDATGEKPLRATVWFSIEHARARDAYVKRQITSLPLDSRENLWLVRARPGFGWSWPKIMSCTTSPGSPKRLLNPNFSPTTPVKKGSTPSSSKYCLVCGIILRIESFYTLSRLELIKNKKSVLEEFQATYNSTVLKNHETTASIKRLAKDSQQNRRTKRICVISNFDANEPGKNCTRTVLFASNCCKTQEDIDCFPLEHEEEKENSFPGYTGSAPSENTCENKPDISKDEIKVRWFI